MQEDVPGTTSGDERAAEPHGASRADGRGDSADTTAGGARVVQNDRARHFSSRRYRKEEPGPEATAMERFNYRAWAFVKEILTILVIALMLSFLIKTFLFRAFYIPSGSMENTLQIDDRIFVNQLVPEPMALNRGDVIVFKDTLGWLADQPSKPRGAFSWIEDAATFVGISPDNSQQHLVKRVIGLPGDTVKCCTVDGKVSVNGVAITEPYIYPGATPSEFPFEVTVPAGHVWVMGDHRNNSEDSRFHQSKNGTGFVPIENIDGRAVVIAWPTSHWKYLSNYSEVFDSIPEPGSTSVGSKQGIPAGQ